MDFIVSSKDVFQEVSGWLESHKEIVLSGVAGISVVGLVYYYVPFRDIARDRLSKYKKYFECPANQGIPSGFRKQLQETRGKPYAENHPHPEAARMRTNADHDINFWILQQGLEVFEVSGATRSQSTQGQSLQYHLRDVSRPYRNQRIGDHHIIKMIDVDYYVDINDYLKYGRPIIMYTFVPLKPADTLPEGNYTIVNDKVQYTVNGGGSFEHELWDYTNDHVIAPTRFGFWVCRIDQMRYTDVNRRAILITPTVWLPFFYRWLYSDAALIKRMKFSVKTTSDPRKKLNVVQVSRRGGGIDTSIAYPGERYSVTINEKAFASLRARLSISKHQHLSDVERILKTAGVAEAAIDAPFYMDYAALTSKGVLVADAGCVPPRDHFYPVGTMMDSAKPCGVRVMEPVVRNPAVFPARGLCQDLLTVQGRIEKPRNNAKPNALMRRFAADFIALFPTSNAVPYSISEVHEKQNKSMQRARSEYERIHSHEALRAKPFMKAEAYPGPKDARNITSVGTSHQLRLSGFTYRFKEDVLKDCPWFVPGGSPFEIAEALRKFVGIEESVLNCDFSRYDGSLSEFLRSIEISVYKRYFQNNTELTELLENELNVRARTTHGVSYDTGSSRLSGSPITTDGNTIITAFMAYCFVRHHQTNKINTLHDIPCFAYGDDLLVKNTTLESVSSVCSTLGLKIKVEQVEQYSPLSFLGRIFVDPWCTLTSIQDVNRALPKLHLSANRSIDPVINIHNKARGYLVTDSLTPLLSAVCKWMMRVYPMSDSSWDKARKRYSDQLIRDGPFWATVDGPWPQDAGDLELMFSVVADAFCLTTSDLHELHNAYVNATTTVPPMLIPNASYAPPPVEMVVNVDEPTIISTNATLSTCIESSSTTTTSSKKKSSGKALNPVK